MTEDEAKTKWCPFARVRLHTRAPTGPTAYHIVPNQPSFNRTLLEGDSSEGGYAGSCIGSICMAWRWMAAPGPTKIEAIKAYRAETGADLRASKDYVDAHWVEPHSQGYCGLAGRAS